jgi:hypothetical protein
VTIELVPLCTVRIELADPVIIGVTPAGTRAIVPVREAVFEGERFRGKAHGTTGADWVTVAADNTATIDVRMLVETHDGAFVYVWYRGRSDFSEGPGGAPIYVAPLFETGDARYAWLNRVQAVAKSELVANSLVYEMYELR